SDALPAILDALCRLVEELSPTSLASILLLDRDGQRLRHGASPSLPQAYVEAIDGISIGPAAGSCGAAAYRNEAGIVPDVADGPDWGAWRGLALAPGVRGS